MSALTWGLVSPSRDQAFNLPLTSGSDITELVGNLLADGLNVRLPAGDFYIGKGMRFRRKGQAVRGESRRSTRLFYRGTGAMFSMDAGLNGIEMSDLSLVYASDFQAPPGVSAIDFSDTSTSFATLYQLYVARFYDNVRLGPTDNSIISHLVTERSVRDALYMTNLASSGVCQWNLDQILAQFAGREGIIFRAIDGPPQVTLGTWRSTNSFACNGHGVSVLGTPATPVMDMRMVTGFHGENGDSNIYLDTYGHSHSIVDSFVELAGRGPTGPAYAVPPTGKGSGIEVTNNNLDLVISATRSIANSYDGMDLNGESDEVSACTIMHNGQAAALGRRSGIRSTSGLVNVTGGRIGNRGGVSQTHGVTITDGNNLTVVGSNLTGNSIAPLAASANMERANLVGCLPNSVPVQVVTTTGMTVGVPTGGAQGGGTINVAGGVLKNGVGYNNP